MKKEEFMKRFSVVLKWFCLPLFILSLVLFVPVVYGQNYPVKPITLIVPYAPGGRTDTVARIVADKLDQYLGQRIIAANRSGAGGVLGEKELTNSKPDGYTISIFSSGTIALQYTVPTPVDLKDYDLVCLVNEDPAALAVSMKSGWKNINDLISLEFITSRVKQRAGKHHKELVDPPQTNRCLPLLPTI